MNSHDEKNQPTTVGSKQPDPPVEVSPPKPEGREKMTPVKNKVSTTKSNNVPNIDPIAFADKASKIFQLEQSNARLYLRRLREACLIPKGHYKRAGNLLYPPGINIEQAVLVLLAFLTSRTAGDAPTIAKEVARLAKSDYHLEHRPGVCSSERNEAQKEWDTAVKAQSAKADKNTSERSLAKQLSHVIGLWILTGRAYYLPSMEVCANMSPPVVRLRYDLPTNKGEHVAFAVESFGKWPEEVTTQQMIERRLLSSSVLPILFAPFRANG